MGISQQSDSFSENQKYNIIKTVILFLNFNFRCFSKIIFLSKPIFIFTDKKVEIKLFFYINHKKEINFSALSNIAIYLEKVFDTKVCFVITRIYYPYLNSNILSQYILHNINSNTFLNFQKAIQIYLFFKNTDLPANIQGIKIQINGRLTTKKIVPRKTTQTAFFGSFSMNINLIYFLH